MQNRHAISSRSGFSLLELSVVLAIIGVVVGIGITSGDKIVQSARVKATNNKMDTIENALMAFRMKYDRLPCPADITAVKGDADYGVENLNATYMTCASYIERGTVPAKTLGLSDEYVVDGWGHKFQYRAGTGGSPFFSNSPLDSSHATNGSANIREGIFINPPAAYQGTRSNAAMYVLLSHGMNGYGSYNEDGTQNSSTGASSEEGIHIGIGSLGSGSGPIGYYYQKEEGSNGFDDIVRFKERWQMQTPDDVFLPKTNTPPFLHLINVGLNYAVLGLHPKGAPWIRSTGIYNSTGFGGATLGLGYTPSNKHIFVYSQVSPYCHLLRIMGTQAVYVTVPNAVESCPVPGSTGYRVSMSDNGYMAISNLSGSEVYLWKLSGDYYRSIGSISPGFVPQTVHFSHEADYMLIGDITTNVRMYKRNADGRGFTQLANQPTFSEDVRMALSPDAKYIVGVSYTSSPYKLYVWRKESNDTFTDLYVASYITTPATALVRPEFSPDGRYLVIGAATSAPFMESIVYRITDDESFEVVTTPVLDALTTGAVAFDKTSRYLLQGGSRNPVMYRKSVDEFVSWGQYGGEYPYGGEGPRNGVIAVSAY